MFKKEGAFSLCYPHDCSCRAGHLFRAWLALSFCIDLYLSCTHICMYIYDSASLLPQEVMRTKLAKRILNSLHGYMVSIQALHLALVGNEVLVLFSILVVCVALDNKPLDLS